MKVLLCGPKNPEIVRNFISRDISCRAVNLPSYHDLSTYDIQFMCRIIQRAFNKAQGGPL